MERLRSSNISFKCLLGLSGLSLILQIVATAIPNWISEKNDNKKLTGGLWSGCTIIEFVGSVCTSFIAVPDFLRACQAFAILCVLLIVLEIFFLGFYIFRSELNERRAKILVLITLISATLCGIICFAVYAGKLVESGRGSNLSSGFYLAVVTCMFLIVTSIVSCFSFN